MISRATRLRLRRRLRMRQHQVEDLSVQAEQRIERQFFGRLERLTAVRRFVVSWVLLMGLVAGMLIVQAKELSNYYQFIQPVPGGVYSEGIVGAFSTANPLYATSAVDTTVSQLVFAGLFTYDNQNRLIGDLASSWEEDTRGTGYTVHLRPNLMWQDGRKLTADDVVFTYHLIQDPNTQSPLAAGWQGIQVSAIDDKTIKFTLPAPLSSFPYSLTTGIVPKHILASVPATSLRTVSFNTLSPVGAGPFEWKKIEVEGVTPDTREERIALTPFANYHKGMPKLSGFVVQAFHDEKSMLRAFQKHRLTAMAGLGAVPSALTARPDSSVYAYSFPLTASVMTFFKTSTGVLSNMRVRQALIRAANVDNIIDQLGYPAVAVTEPLLRNQLGNDSRYQQAGYDPATAAQLLHSAGWALGADGIRRDKEGHPLGFALYFQNTSEYRRDAELLKRQWRAVGVDVSLRPQSETDFDTVLSTRGYDALLYSISIGVDPDVFAYWHSSQADPRSAALNFAEYKSSAADAALENGRTRFLPELRAAKYRPFLAAWQKDAPALGMYQPRYLYITRGQVYGLDEHTINIDTNRFADIQNWMIRTAKVVE